MPTTSTVIVSLNEAQRIVLEVAEVLANDGQAHMPPSLAELMAAEIEGKTWNFQTGQFEQEED